MLLGIPNKLCRPQWWTAYLTLRSIWILNCCKEDGNNTWLKREKMTGAVKIVMNVAQLQLMMYCRKILDFLFVLLLLFLLQIPCKISRIEQEVLSEQLIFSSWDSLEHLWHFYEFCHKTDEMIPNHETFRMECNTPLNKADFVRWSMEVRVQPPSQQPATS